MTHNSIARLCWVFVLLFLAVVSSSAQYSSSNNLGIVRTYSSLCASNVPASQCWVPVAGAPALSQVSVGYDGDLWGIESGTTTPVHYNTASKTWTTVAFPATQLAAVGNGQIFTLNNGVIYSYTIGGVETEYANPYPAAITKISVGKDGDLWALDNIANGCGSGRTWHYDSAHKAWLNENGGVSNISVVNQGLVFASCSGGALFKWTPDSKWVNIGGSSTRIFAAPTEAIEDSTNYVLYGINAGR